MTPEVVVMGSRRDSPSYYGWKGRNSPAGGGGEEETVV